MRDFTPYEAKLLRRKHLFPLIRKYLHDCVAPTIGTFEPEDVDSIWNDEHLEMIRVKAHSFFLSLVEEAVDYRNTPT